MVLGETVCSEGSVWRFVFAVLLAATIGHNTDSLTKFYLDYINTVH